MPKEKRDTLNMQTDEKNRTIKYAEGKENAMSFNT
jgi:hypothetical protein